MTLLEVAQTATALSLLIAASTFIATQVDRSKKAKQERILRWQRVVVFGLVSEGVDRFGDIRSKYLDAAQQYSRAKLPKDDLQDSTLRLILMQLLADNLVSLAEDGRYTPRTTRTVLEDDQIKQYALFQFYQQMNKPKIESRIYDILDRERGIYTIHRLYIKCEAEKLGFNFEEFDVLVRQMIERGSLVLLEGDKLGLARREVSAGGDPRPRDHAP